MTRKGAAQRPWTTEELRILHDAAGRIPAASIARALGRPAGAVAKAAERQGLSLRCRVPRLVWCDECAKWRSHVDADGRCSVCRMRAQLQGREAACAEALAAMDPAQRAVYEDGEPRRRTRRLPPRPVERPSCPASRWQREKAAADHALAVEDWERRCLKLRYDAAKTRLRRMREKTGANPRKKSRTSVEIPDRYRKTRGR